MAYQRDYLLQLAANAGFTLVHEIEGAWCGREKSTYIGFQDIWVLEAHHEGR